VTTAACFICNGPVDLDQPYVDHEFMGLVIIEHPECHDSDEADNDN
jgi:hypothetical protein